MPAMIPRDLHADILVRLPVKSLLRFRCVSRSWKSLISSSGFISKHNEVTHNYFHLLQKEKLGLYEFDDSFTGFRREKFPSQVKGKCYTVVLDCNGLILLTSPYERKGGDGLESLILWNPAVRKSMTLPRPPLEVPKFCHTIYGFGFDHGSNEYKVLRMVYGFVFQHSDIVPLRVLRAELYNLRTGGWKTVRDNEDFGYLIGYGTQSFVNGASHWKGLKSLNPLPDPVVVVFDMCDEEFRFMKLPDRLPPLFHPHVSLGVCGGLLSLINYHEGPIGIVGCSVWLLKEYGVAESWTIRATIDLSDWGVFNRSLLSFRNKEEILFVTDRDMLVLFDLKTQRITDLGIKLEDHGYGLAMNTYKESLVLLNEGRAVSENCFCSKQKDVATTIEGLLRKVH